jgi:hypothetical protein
MRRGWRGAGGRRRLPPPSSLPATATNCLGRGGDRDLLQLQETPHSWCRWRRPRAPDFVALIDFLWPRPCNGKVDGCRVGGPAGWVRVSRGPTTRITYPCTGQGVDPGVSTPCRNRRQPPSSASAWYTPPGLGARQNKREAHGDLWSSLTEQKTARRDGRMDPARVQATFDWPAGTRGLCYTKQMRISSAGARFSSTRGELVAKSPLNYI